METKTILIILAIILPIVQAVFLGRQKDQSASPRNQTAAAIAIAGAAAAFKFILSREYTCFLVSGKETCFYSGFGSLSLICISLTSILISLKRETNEPHDYTFLLLFNATWAGFVLLDNWILSFAFLSLLLISAGRWVRARGGSVGYIVSRDDYKDDIGPK